MRNGPSTNPDDQATFGQTSIVKKHSQCTQVQKQTREHKLNSTSGGIRDYL